MLVKLVYPHECLSDTCSQNFHYSKMKDGETATFLLEDGSYTPIKILRHRDNETTWVCRNAIIPTGNVDLQFTDFKQTLKDL